MARKRAERELRDKGGKPNARSSSHRSCLKEDVEKEIDTRIGGAEGEKQGYPGMKAAGDELEN